MHDYQRDFIAAAIDAKVLSFGEFTLKSGRKSPYFFNAGHFNRGRQLAMLGRCYAEAITRAGLDFSMVFGPAYKGIPLATSTSIALAEQHDRDVPYAFNRKEAKDHGEGGTIVGAQLQGDVLILDDVITAGTAINEAINIIKAQNARPAGIVIALDRQERGRDQASAIEEVQARHGIPVTALVTLDDVLTYIERTENGALRQHSDAIREYRRQYGVQ